MPLKFLNKPLVLRIVLIVFVFLCTIIISNIIFDQYQEKYWEEEQKEIERLSKLSIDELAKEMEEKVIYQPCLNVVSALESENDTCEIFQESDLRDNCYFCFAITKKDELLCNKITEGSSLRKSCEREFLIIEKMDWKTYTESGYSIEYPPYFKVTQEHGSFTTFGLDTDLTRKAGFNLGEYVSMSVLINDLTRESIASEEFRKFFQEKNKKEFSGQEYPDTEEINGQMFYKRESWYYYASLKKVTWQYITRNQEGTKAVIITFESHGILEDNIPSRLNFKEKVLSSFKFLKVENKL